MLADGVLTVIAERNLPAVLLLSVTTCIDPIVIDILALDNATVGVKLTVNEVLFTTDVIMVLLANWPVPLLTMGVVPTQELLVVPVIVTVEAELEAVVVLLYKFHCIDPEPAPGAGNTVAAIIIFTLKKRLLF